MSNRDPGVKTVNDQEKRERLMFLEESPRSLRSFLFFLFVFVPESSCSIMKARAVKESSSSDKSGRLHQKMPILMFVGSMQETNDFGNKFKAFLEENGANVRFVKTELLHSMKRFSKEYGQQAIKFFLQK